MTPFIDPTLALATVTGVGAFLFTRLVGTSHAISISLALVMAALVRVGGRYYTPTVHEQAILGGIAAIALVFGVLGAVFYHHGPRGELESEHTT